jgi:hypothetical protein
MVDSATEFGRLIGPCVEQCCAPDTLKVCPITLQHKSNCCARYKKPAL